MNKLGTKIILIILLTLVVASQFATSAGSYQQCKAEYANQKGKNESQTNNTWVALGAFNRWAVCTGRVIDANRESISAIGTLVIALFTVILGAGTIGLWSATKRLAESAEDTARKQLRAYVGIGTKGFYPDEKTGRPKMQITNFGSTPAKDVTILWALAEDAMCPLSYSGGDTIATNILIQPKQDMHFFWAETPAEREFKIVYGYIDYTDINGKKWRTRFAWQHMRDTWFLPHDEHNDEIERKDS